MDSATPLLSLSTKTNKHQQLDNRGLTLAAVLRSFPQSLMILIFAGFRPFMSVNVNMDTRKNRPHQQLFLHKNQIKTPLDPGLEDLGKSEDFPSARAAC